jgi:SAM-dependent methyltransferase
MIETKDWAGRFGNEYTKRGIDTSGRAQFWNALIDRHKIASVLEVGCGDGANLADMKVTAVGVDVNQTALEIAHRRNVDTMLCEATDLPFPDGSFDLVLTFGVLIHIPLEDLGRAMREIRRVSRRFVFCGEYLGTGEVPYRGGVLWPRDYGGRYRDMGLKLRERGTLVGPPWDRNKVNWWLFEKPRFDDDDLAWNWDV